MSPYRVQPASPRSFQFTLFLVGVLWIMAAGNIASRAAQGIVTRFNLPALDQLLQQAFFLFLLLWGFATVRWIATRNVLSPASGAPGQTSGAPSQIGEQKGDVRSANALPKRTTAGQEWKRGAALGWGMLLVAILPMLFTRNLHPELSLAPQNWGLALLSLAAIAFASLALEVAFRGFVFARLIRCTTPVAATVILSLIYAFISGYAANASAVSVSVSFLLAVLFSIAYLRTHALWLGWGLHFGWNASMALVFGLPIAGNATYNNLIFTSVTGPDWLTGGPYGPEAALLTILVVLAAIVVLYRISRSYAWNYTHAPIVAAGYPMDIAPPAAHTAMEAASAAPAPLVQIISTTSTTSSTHPAIDEHLRRESGTDPNPRD